MKTKKVSSKFEGRKANEDKDESNNRNSAPMTPVNSVTSQNGFIEDNTKNEHTDSNAGKDNFEEILELRNAERYAKDNIYSPNRVKAMKKSRFRIISVTDTVNHETDDESALLDDEKEETISEGGNNVESLGLNEQNNIEPNSKTAKKNSVKSNQSLENLLKVPGDSSERRDESDTEIDIAEREKEEPKSQNKLKFSFKALNKDDSITALEVEPEDSEVKLI